MVEISELLEKIDVLSKEKQAQEAKILKYKQAIEDYDKTEMRLKDLLIKQKLIIDQMTKQDAFYVKIIETLCSVIEESI